MIRKRARALRELGERKAAEFRAAQAGNVVRALTLRRKGEGWTEALSGNYLKLRVAGDWPANTWVDVRAGADGAVATAQAIGN